MLKGITELEQRGLKKIVVERLLPDPFGGFLEAETAAEYEKWIEEGAPWLEEL